MSISLAEWPHAQSPAGHRHHRTVRADRETIELRLADLARLSEQIRALTALRDRLEAELRTQGNAAQQATRLADSAQAQVALLSRQLDELRSQLSRITAALDLAEAQGRDKDTQIANLGQRLNAALAAQVETLQRYRSDFFGKLREVLGNRPEIRVVGDRFVFQSEVLFPPGSAELSEAGQAQIRRVGGVLRDISRRIPGDVNWVLRVDGHADRTPISNQRFASNWELSAARSIAVSRLLVQEGLPANRVAAAAFGENQPLDPGEGAEAFARNRRIDAARRDRVDFVDPSDYLFDIPDESNADADGLLDAQSREDVLRRQLATLPSEQLELVRLAFFDGLSHSEIAERTGLPLGTVKSRIRLAFTRLRRGLEGGGVSGAT